MMKEAERLTLIAEAGYPMDHALCVFRRVKRTTLRYEEAPVFLGYMVALQIHVYGTRHLVKMETVDAFQYVSNAVGGFLFVGVGADRLHELRTRP